MERTVALDGGVWPVLRVSDMNIEKLEAMTKRGAAFSQCSRRAGGRPCCRQAVQVARGRRESRDSIKIRFTCITVSILSSGCIGLHSTAD